MPTVLITGANRGLGFEFARQYAADGWRVHAACRCPPEAEALNALAKHASDFRIHELDVANLRLVDAFARALAGQPIDVLLLNAGVFGPTGEDRESRQDFGAVDTEAMHSVFQINVVSPLRMAEAFVEHVAASEQRKIVAMSSRMGSVRLTSGGSYVYRTSKAALNMAMATLAEDVRALGVSVGIYSPGWVRTDMGGLNAPLTPEASVAGVRSQVAGLGLKNSGKFFDQEGEPIAW